MAAMDRCHRSSSSARRRLITGDRRPSPQASIHIPQSATDAGPSDMRRMRSIFAAGRALLDTMRSIRSSSADASAARVAAISSSFVPKW